MPIYTKRGDQGETGLLFGGRVSKNDPRVEAYGAADEAVSAMGLARGLSRDGRVKEILLKVQRQMFTVGAELATAIEHHDRLHDRVGVVTSEMVRELEGFTDELDALIDLPRAFIVPGASPASGALDLARSLVRRAERRVVALQQEDMLANQEILRYLNRLSDLLFIIARYEDREMPFELASGEAT